MGIEQNFFKWISIAKGIGIILVVTGHFHPGNAPIYWDHVISIIYSFHMPLFFILSGFLYNQTKYTYPELVAGKVKRLGYPFASVAILFLLIKYMAGLLFQLEHPVAMESIVALLINPVNSYMPLLWFVHALLLIFLIYPLVRNIITENNFAILAMFVLINLLMGNRYPVIGNALANMPFFVIGVILRENEVARQTVVSGKRGAITISLVLFIIIYLIIQNISGEHQAGYLLVLAAGIAGAICIMNISYLIDTISSGIGKNLLTEAGIYSMTIYLFHTLFESAVEIGFRQFSPSIQPDFWIIAIAAVGAGILFPLILEKMLLRKYAVTRRYLLGLS